MDFEKDLLQLKKTIGKDSEAFSEVFTRLSEKYPDRKELIIDFVEKELKAVGQRIDAFIEEANVRMQLAKVSQIISLSYIAQKYFHRTRNWLYQKVNGCSVNGKPAKFTTEEISTFNFALQDIGKEIGSTVIKI
jgi:hypothetical protein